MSKWSLHHQKDEDLQRTEEKVEEAQELLFGDGAPAGLTMKPDSAQKSLTSQTRELERWGSG
jgi:hypothetical protein